MSRLAVANVLALLVTACTGSHDPWDAGGARDAGAHPPARDAGAPPPARDSAPICARDLDCDDGRFCTGIERCSPRAPDASAAGCVGGSPPCDDCDEAADLCLGPCDLDPDGDGDGEPRIECGGRDCDDANDLIHPGADEACDGRDDDCDSSVDETAAMTCPPEPHATMACEAASCVVGSCDTGFGDCEPAVEGCETALDSIDHCGACGNACAVGGWCEGGGCRPTEGWLGSTPAQVRDIEVDDLGHLYVVGCVRGTQTIGGASLTSVGGTSYASGFVASLDGAGTYRWGHVFGSGAGGSCATALARDSSGNLYARANVAPSTDLGGGVVSSVASVAVVSWDATGGHRWATLFAGGTGYPGDGDVAADGTAGAVFVSGAFTGAVTVDATSLSGTNDAFFVRLHAGTGAVEWLTHAPGAGGEVPAIAAQGGSLWVTGRIYRETATLGGFTLGSPTTDPGFVAALGTVDGTFSRARPLATGGSTGGMDIAVASGGRIYVVGFVYGTVDFGTGSAGMLVTDDQDGFVLALEESTSGLVPLWAALQTGPDLGWSARVVLDEAERPRIVGASWTPMDLGAGSTGNGTRGVYAVGLDSSGAHVWSRVVDTPSPDLPWAAASVPGDGLLIAVETHGGYDWAGARRGTGQAFLTLAP